MAVRGRTANIPRLNWEPMFIDNECEECGGALRPFDSVNHSEKDPRDYWWDEWCCPVCNDGIYMDWPEDELEQLHDLDASVDARTFQEYLQETSVIWRFKFWFRKNILGKDK